MVLGCRLNLGGTSPVSPDRRGFAAMFVSMVVSDAVQLSELEAC